MKRIPAPPSTQVKTSPKTSHSNSLSAISQWPVWATSFLVVNPVAT